MLEYFGQQFTIIKQIFRNLGLISLLLMTRSPTKIMARDKNVRIVKFKDLYTGRLFIGALLMQDK